MGFSREEVIGQSIRSFMTPESVAYSRAVSWPTLLEKGEMLDLITHQKFLRPGTLMWSEEPAFELAEPWGWVGLKR